ncbi:MAG: hypothetical protein PVH42_16660, partial [Desulfobacterales bacterium]
SPFDIRYSRFKSFFFDLTNRFFGRRLRRHLYFTTLNYQRACCPAGATFSERSLGENLVP